MNAYLVHIPEERLSHYYTGGLEPPEPVWPLEIVCAETLSQARYDFLREMPYRSGSGVETDDWTAIRVRLLAKDVPFGRVCGIPEPKGDPEKRLPGDEWYYRFWLRIHEIEDHGGKPCDCPEADV